MSAYDFERARPDFLHQEAVDAYAAQHPGPPARPISVWFALVGLHLAIGQGRSGRQVQFAHMRLGRHKRVWPPLQPPASLTCMTAGDVMRQDPGDDRDRAIARSASLVTGNTGQAGPLSLQSLALAEAAGTPAALISAPA